VSPINEDLLIIWVEDIKIVFLTGRYASSADSDDQDKYSFYLRIHYDLLT